MILGMISKVFRLVALVTFWHVQWIFTFQHSNRIIETGNITKSKGNIWRSKQIQEMLNYCGNVLNFFLSDPDVRLENKEYKTQKQCYMKNKTGKQ